MNKSKIFLPYGNNEFEIEKLISYVKSLPEKYIIQGHAKCTFEEHKKKKSLDYWLRKNYVKNKDTMQAVSSVIEEIEKTGHFVKGKYMCPETGKKCGGLKLKNA